ncbi:MAG: DUF6345 domain-containing protein, partial [Planctomycetota bacterium]|jgi:hypothetical protein
MFGRHDPIYIKAGNFGVDPLTAESFPDVVKVEVEADGNEVSLSLKETGADTNVFTNAPPDANQLLYLSDSTSGTSLKVDDEPILIFSLKIQPGTGDYDSCYRVMVDRAEKGVDYEKDAYSLTPPCEACDLRTEMFACGWCDTMGPSPHTNWFLNFKRQDYAGLPAHWTEPGDANFVGSADIISWGGHSIGEWKLHDHESDGTCSHVDRTDIGWSLAESDVEWVIFDTCWLLHGSDAELRAELLPGDPMTRCPHMFLGSANHDDIMTGPSLGSIFTQFLRVGGIKQAWWDFADASQLPGWRATVFRPTNRDYDTEFIGGSGPVEIERDPTESYSWQADHHDARRSGT